jgi:Flp pilus assembly protein TadB
VKIRRDPTQTATSLERSPQDDESHRMRTYIITMAVRTLCLLLMVLVTPYHWYTFVFAAGAAFLPYVAVVVANAAQSGRVSQAVAPERRALPTPPPAPPADAQRVLRIDETGPDREDGPS